jgi:molybdopterin synthase catalytic subunit
MIVRLDHERALRLVGVVRSWHRPDDDAGALDCFKGMVRGEIEEAEIVAIWREAMQPRIRPL